MNKTLRWPLVIDLYSCLCMDTGMQKTEEQRMAEKENDDAEP